MLELSEDPRYEQRAYRVRSIASVLGALLLAAGLLGLLGGDGPLADADATSDGDALELRYERFLHWRTSGELHVRFATGEQDTDVGFSRDYLEGVDVRASSAEPESVTTLSDRVVYTFELAAPAEVTFSVDPQRIGRQGIAYGPGGSSVTFTHWCIPDGARPARRGRRPAVAAVPAADRQRALAQLTTFDFILLLMIGEATQQALLGQDYSIAGAALVIATLIGLNRISDFIAWRWPRIDRLLNDSPVVLVEDGKPDEERLRTYRITPQEILEQARTGQGIERMDEIRYAVLERTGAIAIIPRRQ